MKLIARARDERFPTEQVRAIPELRRTLDALERTALLSLHEHGFSWEEIASFRGGSRNAIRRFLDRTGGMPEEVEARV